VSGACTIELAGPADVAALPAVELRAASLFAGLGVADAVLNEATPLRTLAAAQAEGRLWIARSAAGEPVGFALVERVDGVPHLSEMDVLPDYGGRGVGRALLEAVSRQAAAAGHRALTLTTFRDVPWNAPFYARAGFRELAPAELGPGLAAILRGEAERGLDPAKRVAMRRPLALAHTAAERGLEEGRA
jgi:GNAT superfamily N-acetyltransferase